MKQPLFWQGFAFEPHDDLQPAFLVGGMRPLQETPPELVLEPPLAPLEEEEEEEEEEEDEDDDVLDAPLVPDDEAPLVPLDPLAGAGVPPPSSAAPASSWLLDSSMTGAPEPMAQAASSVTSARGRLRPTAAIRNPSMGTSKARDVAPTLWASNARTTCHREFTKALGHLARND